MLKNLLWKHKIKCVSLPTASGALFSHYKLNSYKIFAQQQQHEQQQLQQQKQQQQHEELEPKKTKLRESIHPNPMARAFIVGWACAIPFYSTCLPFLYFSY